jgi:hypothetical protein
MQNNFSSMQLIAEIVAAFGGENPDRAKDIPRSKVLEWMRSPDIQVRGALYSMVSEAGRASHIKPSLQFEDYYGFVLDYLEQCIEENRDEDWVDSRYLAGHELVAWIVDFWKNPSIPRERHAEIKRRLAALYQRGDDGVRDGVINGVLEHLFENRGIAKYYQSWENDPVLAKAYKDALLWSDADGVGKR